MPDVFLVGYTEERAMGSKKIEVQSKKKTGQSKIQKNLLVEQKTGGFVVLSTPLIELPIQKTLAKAKIRLQMFHVKHFCTNHRETMIGRSAHPYIMSYYAGLFRA